MDEIRIDYQTGVLADRHLALDMSENAFEDVPEMRRSEPKHPDSDYIAIIDHRMLERECLAHGLVNHHISRKVATYANLQQWQETKGDFGLPRAVLFNAGNADISDDLPVQEISELVTAMAPSAVIVLSENQDLTAVLRIIALGVRGYIPSSVGIDVCIQAIGLAIAGGKFIPASSVLSMRNFLGMANAQKAPVASKFTSRQSAVAEALRCGKANKVIASELNLCESTVKVHIRNIMKKLGATNRTEVAYKIGGMVTEHRHSA
jgi:DNA-binding NarL/FixJ family response regulator